MYYAFVHVQRVLVDMSLHACVQSFVKIFRKQNLLAIFNNTAYRLNKLWLTVLTRM